MIKTILSKEMSSENIQGRYSFKPVSMTSWKLRTDATLIMTAIVFQKRISQRSTGQFVNKVPQMRPPSWFQDQDDVQGHGLFKDFISFPDQKPSFHLNTSAFELSHCFKGITRLFCIGSEAHDVFLAFIFIHLSGQALSKQLQFL